MWNISVPFVNTVVYIAPKRVRGLSVCARLTVVCVCVSALCARAHTKTAHACVELVRTSPRARHVACLHACVRVSKSLYALRNMDGLVRLHRIYAPGLRARYTLRSFDSHSFQTKTTFSLAITIVCYFTSILQFVFCAHAEISPDR